MATRAIRYNKLNFGNTTSTTDTLDWLRYRPNNMNMRTSLQEACIYGITHAGDSAQDIQQNLNNMMNQLPQMNNYFQVLNQVYSKLLPYLINLEAENHGLDSFMRDKMIEMRDYAKANAVPHPHYGHNHFDGRTDQTFMDMFNELRNEVSTVASSVNAKYFPPTIFTNNRFGRAIVQANVNYNIVDVETTDEHIENWITANAYNDYSRIWGKNIYYFLRGGYGQNNAHQYPPIPADVMEGFMAHLTENHPLLTLMLAKNNQMFIDNPQIRSIGHSWTSKNRSDDCWFKEAYDQVDKKNTTVFAPPVNLFGQFVPSFTDMLDVFKTKKADILQFLDDIQPILKLKKDAKQALEEKTAKSIEEGMTVVIQGLLDDPATVDIGTAIIGNIAGIANLPIDFTNLAQSNGYIQFTYHDFQRKEDVVSHIYPHQMRDAIPLTAFNITDKVQGVIYEAYRKELESCHTNHANRCAQLARQISQATTRHDANIATLTEAFKEYQAQV